MKKPPLKQLDPAIEAFIKALARECARQDHEEWLSGKKTPPVEPDPPATKSRTGVVVRISDGKGGYRYRPKDGRWDREAFQQKMQRVLADWKAGRHDELGLSKQLKMPFPKLSPKS